MRHSEPISLVVCMRSRGHSLAQLQPTLLSIPCISAMACICGQICSPETWIKLGAKSYTTTLVARTHAVTKSSTSCRREDDEVRLIWELDCTASYMPRTQVSSMEPDPNSTVLPHLWARTHGGLQNVSSYASSPSTTFPGRGSIRIKVQSSARGCQSFPCVIEDTLA